MKLRSPIEPQIPRNLTPTTRPVLLMTQPTKKTVQKIIYNEKTVRLSRSTEHNQKESVVKILREEMLNRVAMHVLSNQDRWLIEILLNQQQ